MAMRREADARSCDVAGCDEVSERSLNIKQVVDTGMSLKDPEARTVHLCREHYKEYKKISKSSRRLDSIY